MRQPAMLSSFKRLNLNHSVHGRGGDYAWIRLERLNAQEAVVVCRLFVYSDP